jgi:hypothetical protein
MVYWEYLRRYGYNMFIERRDPETRRLLPDTGLEDEGNQNTHETPEL